MCFVCGRDRVTHFKSPSNAKASAVGTATAVGAQAAIPPINSRSRSSRARRRRAARESDSHAAATTDSNTADQHLSDFERRLLAARAKLPAPKPGPRTPGQLLAEAVAASKPSSSSPSGPLPSSSSPATTTMTEAPHQLPACVDGDTELIVATPLTPALEAQTGAFSQISMEALINAALRMAEQQSSPHAAKVLKTAAAAVMEDVAKTAGTAAPETGSPPRKPRAQPNSPAQELAQCEERLAKVRRELADHLTHSSEAAKRRIEKNGADLLNYEAEIKRQIEALSLWKDAVTAADAEFKKADAAKRARLDEQIAEADLAVGNAKRLVDDSGENHAARPKPVAAGEPPSDINVDDDNDGDDNDTSDQDGDMATDCDDADTIRVPAMVVVDYLEPPILDGSDFSAQDKAVLSTARTTMCHWLAQPPEMPLRYGALGLPIAQVRLLIGEEAWLRPYSTETNVTLDDVVPREIAGVLLDAIGRMNLAPSSPGAAAGTAFSIAAAASVTTARRRPEKPIGKALVRKQAKR